MNNSLLRRLAEGAALCLAFVVLTVNLPVNCLEIRDAETTVLRTAFSSGQTFETFYIHSVERTPVIDEYCVMQGQIWTWEERVRSHNAGLPFGAPAFGRFLVAPPWMIVQGGRRETNRIAYRVGTDTLGQNRWSLAPFGSIDAYRLFPGQRLYFVSAVVPWRKAGTIALPR